MRYKKLVYLENGYIIDNIENILANKITAVMGRDNAKDIFDIYLIAQFYNPKWKEVIDIAHEKAGFCNDDFIIRLKTFPVLLLKNIVLVDSDFLDNFDEKYKSLVENIEDEI